MSGEAATGGSWREVAAVFGRLGVIGFGGPAAHIALMREEVVRRRSWLDDAEFMELVGATNLIPGPNSTELAIHLGHRRAGAAGLVAGGVCFIAPAVVIVSFLAWLYAEHGTSPAVVDLRYGILPVIVAIVAHAAWGLGRTTLVDATHVVLAGGALAAWFAGVDEILVILVAGAAAALWHERGRLGTAPRSLGAFLPVFALLRDRRGARDATAVATHRIFFVFLEVGSVLYGSGYVLVALLQRMLVDDRGWLTGAQLLDAVSVGQVTPGPVFTTATFVGWQVDGPRGAAAATVGIFLPSFVFVALLGRLVPWLRRRPAARAFLRGVTAASLGLLVGVTFDLADAAVRDAATAAFAMGALVVLHRWRPSSTWLVGAGALVGVAHSLLA